MQVVPFRRARIGDGPPVPAIGESIAGWRIVRHLAARDRWGEAIVAADLPSADEIRASAHWHEFAPRSRARELVTRRAWFALDEEVPSLIAECTLRESLEAEFVERPLEVLTEEGWAIAIREPGVETSYAELVAADRMPEPGAAITLLVPVIETVLAAHGAGVGHGALNLRACRFDELGRPHVAAWSDAVALDALPALRAALVRTNDGKALGRILDAVLARVRGGAPEELGRLVSALIDTGDVAALGPRIVDALFEWSVPGPVPNAELTGDPPDRSPPGPTVAGPQLRGAAGGRGDDESGARPSPMDADMTNPIVLPRSTDDDAPLLEPPMAAGAPQWRRPGPSGIGWTDEARARLAAAAGAVRSSVWLALAALGLVGALAGGVLGMPGAVGEPGPGSASPAAGGDPIGQAGVPADPGGTDAAATGPQDPVGGGAALDEAGSALPGPGMDAAESVPILVAARAACLEGDGGESSACLAAVYAEGAPGLAADERGPSRPLHGGEWGLTSDLGDIELFHAVDALESVSVQRTPDGWRLRELWWDTLGTPDPVSG